MNEIMRGKSQNFGLLLWFRGGLIGLLMWSILAFPPKNAMLFWTLSGIWAMEEGILYSLWMMREKLSTWLPCLAAAAFLVDSWIGGAIFCFSMMTSHPIAPTLLQFLTFEGFAFWEVIGAATGFLLSMVILFIGWGINHQTLSELILWSGSSLLLGGILPITIGSSSHLTLTNSSKLHSNPVDNLTPRQKEIYELLRSGHSQTEIANRLMIEVGTVKTHIHQIYRKFNIHHREDL